ncbi:MAG: hypothetical protein LBH07_07960 [Treponema sp.]|jgi:N-acetylglucosamine kinase-like BadF-type ATPase|nr:hypothetical protein [Treponema sp.]
MDNYVIGIDTGATKSHLALFDTAGSYIDFARWGPLNHEVLPGSFAQFEDELGKFVTGCLEKNGVSVKQVRYAVLGIAGVDTKLQHGIISGIVRKIGLEQFTLVNDSFLGIPAGTSAGTGVCAINGSGCTLAGINKQGKMLQIGGVGYVSDDYGGGGMMGEKVISTVYSELFRRGKATKMTPVLLEKLGLVNKYDFVDKVYEKIEDGSLNIAACTKMLFLAVLENDQVAADILRDIAISYASGISCMIEEMEYPKEEEINIVFAGSVFVKSEHPLLLDTIKETVNRDNSAYRIKYTLLNVPPVAGAIVWALNILNNRNIFYDKVCAQLLNL